MGRDSGNKPVSRNPNHACTNEAAPGSCGVKCRCRAGWGFQERSILSHPCHLTDQSLSSRHWFVSTTGVSCQDQSCSQRNGNPCETQNSTPTFTTRPWRLSRPLSKHPARAPPTLPRDTFMTLFPAPPQTLVTGPEGPPQCSPVAPLRPLHLPPDRFGSLHWSPSAPQIPGGPGCHRTRLEPQTGPQPRAHPPASRSSSAGTHERPGRRVPF